MTPLPVVIAAAVQAPAEGGTLVVDIAGVRDASGVVRVDLCRETQFLKQDCTYAASAPARAGVTRVTVRGVVPGQYAIQAFHDANNNGDVDRGLFGIPREGVGFSRDARIALGPPKWRDAVFAVAAGAQRTTLSLRYFIGSRTPRATR